ncbi:hypothetical protein OSB04_025796 [Centaurea solstitialis]|uniref:protein-serine/threonine phosphatase n=1 Tax=Centaurea solstitialis TaxID=347529 RepID=A0AA38SNR1_9ASTR|nr:hypothetical protein OSB04_025796 [Centaurea solstitialis]
MDALPPIRYMDYVMDVKEDSTINYERLLQLLPVAALIDENIFYMHGELSPNFNNLDQIKNLRHPTDLSNGGWLCDFLWSHLRSFIKFLLSILLSSFIIGMMWILLARHISGLNVYARFFLVYSFDPKMINR